MTGVRKKTGAPVLDATRRLIAVKLLHTVIWGFFAGCIVAIPVSSFLGNHQYSLLFTAIVGVEVLVLGFNRMRCPLTDVAARYTAQRGDNFDIYLPAWLARHNKTIFGSLYVFGIVVALMNWIGV
jgi:hypothetical protein